MYLNISAKGPIYVLTHADTIRIKSKEVTYYLKLSKHLKYHSLKIKKRLGSFTSNNYSSSISTLLTITHLKPQSSMHNQMNQNFDCTLLTNPKTIIVETFKHF